MAWMPVVRGAEKPPVGEACRRLKKDHLESRAALVRYFVERARWSTARRFPGHWSLSRRFWRSRAAPGRAGHRRLMRSTHPSAAVQEGAWTDEQFDSWSTRSSSGSTNKITDRGRLESGLTLKLDWLAALVQDQRSPEEKTRDRGPRRHQAIPRRDAGDEAAVPANQGRPDSVCQDAAAACRNPDIRRLRTFRRRLVILQDAAENAFDRSRPRRTRERVEESRAFAHRAAVAPSGAILRHGRWLERRAAASS